MDASPGDGGGLGEHLLSLSSRSPHCPCVHHQRLPLPFDALLTRTGMLRANPCGTAGCSQHSRCRSHPRLCNPPVPEPSLSCQLPRSQAGVIHPGHLVLPKPAWKLGRGGRKASSGPGLASDVLVGSCCSPNLALLLALSTSDRNVLALQML